MSNSSPFHERLQRAFSPTDHGVAGLVDDILTLCRDQPFEFVWQDNQCRVRPLGRGLQDATDITLAKSVFRAILARIAALCNERVPNAVSPYGGAGELSMDANPSTVFHVAFTNSPDEQRLAVNCRENGVGEVNATQEILDSPSCGNGEADNERSAVPQRLG